MKLVMEMKKAIHRILEIRTTWTTYENHIPDPRYRKPQDRQLGKDARIRPENHDPRSSVGCKPTRKISSSPSACCGENDVGKSLKDNNEVSTAAGRPDSPLKGSIGENHAIATATANINRHFPWQAIALALPALMTLDGTPVTAKEAALATVSTDGTAAAFSQSFIILLREGTEAILIFAALWVALKALHAPARAFAALSGGAVAGIAASVIAAVAVAVFSSRVGETAELLEGAALILATAVLIFVSSWLLGQREAAQWKKRMQAQARAALIGRSLIGLFVVGFLVVFREGAETVLFFYALIAAEGFMPTPIITGALLAIAILGVAFALVHHLGIRLPLKAFFTITAWALFALAVIYAGKGVHELQEFGLLAETPLAIVPEVKALGIYPYGETVAAQLITLMAGLVLNMRMLNAAPPRQRQPAE